MSQPVQLLAKDWKSLVAADKFEELFLGLEEHLNSRSEAFNVFVNLKRRYNKLHKSKLGGTISHENAELEYNQISIALIAAIDVVQASDLGGADAGLDELKPLEIIKNPSVKEEHAWEFTADTDTRTAYEKFLNRFPDGFYAANARERLDYFDADDTAWEFATDNATEKAIQKYLDKYPNGLHATKASQKIAEFESERQEAARKKRKQEEAEQNRIATEAARRKREQEETEQNRLVTEAARKKREQEIAQRSITAEAARKKQEQEFIERRRIIDPFYSLMVPIKGGTFQMGDTLGEGAENERPVHWVSLSDYWLCKYPVTLGLWKVVMGVNNNPSNFKVDDMVPMEGVSWDQAQAFIEILNKKTGGEYRLPTEAEWEYAAREGGKKIRFGNGKDIANPAEMNFDATKKDNQPYSIVGQYRGQSTPVNQFSPNALGLHDMAGNVSEWCADWFGDDYYQQCYVRGTVLNPRGPDTGTSRALRCGSGIKGPRDCRASSRNHGLPTRPLSIVGFRVASSHQ